MIHFHILGAGGAVPTPTHCPAAYWVGLDDDFMLLDPGPGALVRLVKAGLVPKGVDNVDLVVLSHLHPDHSADLVPLLFATHSPICRSTVPLRIFGPVGLKALLARLKDIYGRWLVPRNRPLEVEEWAPHQALALPGGGRIEPFPVNHPQDRLSETPLGYRFMAVDGARVVFSGDSGPCAALNDAARGADLLVVECSVPDHLATDGHLNPAAVGALCADSRPRRVVLTHQYPAAADRDLAKEIAPYFDGPVHQARDGDVFEISRQSR